MDRCVALPAVHGSTFSPSRSRTATHHEKYQAEAQHQHHRDAEHPELEHGEGGDRGRACDSRHLTEGHEGVGPAVLLGLQHVDGHAVDSHVLRGGETVQQETQRGQQRHVLQRLREECERNAGQHEA